MNANQHARERLLCEPLPKFDRVKFVHTRRDGSGGMLDGWAGCGLILARGIHTAGFAVYTSDGDLLVGSTKTGTCNLSYGEAKRWAFWLARLGLTTRDRGEGSRYRSRLLKAWDRREWAELERLLVGPPGRGLTRPATT